MKNNFSNIIEGESIIDIPKGLGQVINPDVAKNILTTAYPKIIP